MQYIEIDKSKLVARISENMKTHKQTYETAIDVFKTRQTELLEELIAKSRAGETLTSEDKRRVWQMPVPENHLRDYQIALEMLELDNREVLDLTHSEYLKYYRDEWEWHSSFHANTVGYSLQA